MNFTPFTPPSPANHYLETVFHYDGFCPDHSIERLVPTGRIHLIFELDDIERYTYDNDSQEINGRYAKAWISGVHSKYISISAHQNSSMLVAQFKPCGSYPVLQRPASSLSEAIVPAEELLGSEVLELRHEILDTSSAIDKCQLLAQWLEKRTNPDLTAPTKLVKFVEEIEKQPASQLAALIENYPSSQKALIDHFKKYVGHTPKYYQRIARFTDLMAKIQQKEKLNWTDIANDCGFTDQSHFIKEFNYFSGFNPSEFITQDYEKEYTNFFPLDRES